MMRLSKLFVLAFALLLLVPFAALAAAVTPEQVRAWFDIAFVPVMWAVGALYAKFPAFRNAPNVAIPWLNLGVYVLSKLVLPGDAQAAGWFDGVKDFGGALWVTARGAATSAVASLLWDKFLKSPVGVFLPNALPDKQR